VINLNFYFWLINILFIYLYGEIFNKLTYSSIFKDLKFFNINFTKKTFSIHFKNNLFSIIINLIIFYILTLKVDFINHNLLTLFIIFCFISKIIQKYNASNLAFILFNIFFFLIMSLFLNSFIYFFMYIELYAIIFYFFFLNTNNNSSVTLLQLKNGLILYLVNNFFTTILFLLGLNSIIEIFGTTNFIEMQYLTYSCNYYKIYPLIIGFILKLALPGFHFLKLEIYKYISFDTVIIFSTITIFFNYMLTIYFFNISIISNTIITFKIFNLLILLSFFFLIQKTKINNFHEFIAFSGFATNNLILLNFII